MIKVILTTLSFCVLSVLTGCATCKSSDTVEQCRTKERDHGQHRVQLPNTTGVKTLVV